jgi:hypothetical protein
VVLRFRLLNEDGGDWASFVPMIGGWSDERLSVTTGDNGPGVGLTATARPASVEPANAPSGPGIFALRWFECAAADSEEFVELSSSAWPAFEAGTPGTRIFGLFRADDAPDASGDAACFLLCTRYPSLAAWESSRADTRSPQFRRRAEMTRRTQVSVWRLA